MASPEDPRRAVRLDKSVEFLMAIGREVSFFCSQMVEFLAQQNEKRNLSLIFLASDNKLCSRGETYMTMRLFIVKKRYPTKNFWKENEYLPSELLRKGGKNYRSFYKS